MYSSQHCAITIQLNEGKANTAIRNGDPQDCEILRPPILYEQLVHSYAQEDSWYLFLLEGESTPGP
jgi:hypothetical protein